MSGSRSAAPRADTHPYRRRLIAVGTRHGKQHQFAPAFREVLDAGLITPADLDTDRFGTFTPETPRSLPPVDAARAKAHLAMAATGLPYGLASEASYTWFRHEEILLFCDSALGIEVMEGHRTARVPGITHRVADAAELPDGVLAGLPDQALIVRPSRPGIGTITKGISEIHAARAAIAEAAACSPDGFAVVEPDLRAHHNPSRRRVLAGLADTLAHRLATACPSCGAPGFGRIGAESGLPCRCCATPTPLPRSVIHGCAACPHRVDQPAVGQADPADCPSCNP